MRFSQDGTGRFVDGGAEDGFALVTVRAGVFAFWILVAAIVGARATLFQPDPFASFRSVALEPASTSYAAQH